MTSNKQTNEQKGKKANADKLHLRFPFFSLFIPFNRHFPSYPHIYSLYIALNVDDSRKLMAVSRIDLKKKKLIEPLFSFGSRPFGGVLFKHLEMVNSSRQTKGIWRQMVILPTNEH